MTSLYLDALVKRHSRGPYLFAGYSFGGFVAYEMGQQARARGIAVPIVVLLDTLHHLADWPPVGDDGGAGCTVTGSRSRRRPA